MREETEENKRCFFRCILKQNYSFAVSLSAYSYAEGT
jgi:hypothetical protein